MQEESGHLQVPKAALEITVEDAKGAARVFYDSDHGSGSGSEKQAGAILGPEAPSSPQAQEPEGGVQWHGWLHNVMNEYIRISEHVELQSEQIQVLQSLESHVRDAAYFVFPETMPFDQQREQVQLLTALCRRVLATVDEIPPFHRDYYLDYLLAVIQRREFDLGLDPALAAEVKAQRHRERKRSITNRSLSAQPPSQPQSPVSRRPSLDLVPISREDSVEVCRAFYDTLLVPLATYAFDNWKKRVLNTSHKAFCVKLLGVLLIKMPPLADAILHNLRVPGEGGLTSVQMELKEFCELHNAVEDVSDQWRRQSEEFKLAYPSLFKWGAFGSESDNAAFVEQYRDVIVSKLKDDDILVFIDSYVSFVEGRVRGGGSRARFSYVEWLTAPGFAVIVQYLMSKFISLRDNGVGHDEMLALERERLDQTLLRVFSVCPQLLKYFVKQILLTTPLYDAAQILDSFSYVEYYIESTLDEEKVEIRHAQNVYCCIYEASLPENFCFNTMFDALKMMIDSDHFVIMLTALRFLYNNLGRLPVLVRSEYISKLLIDNFFPLMLHWMGDVRRLFTFIIVYKIDRVGLVKLGKRAARWSLKAQGRASDGSKHRHRRHGSTHFTAQPSSSLIRTLVTTISGFFQSPQQSELVPQVTAPENANDLPPLDELRLVTSSSDEVVPLSTSPREEADQVNNEFYGGFSRVSWLDEVKIPPPLSDCVLLQSSLTQEEVDIDEQLLIRIDNCVTELRSSRVEARLFPYVERALIDYEFIKSNFLRVQSSGKKRQRMLPGQVWVPVLNMQDFATQLSM